MKWPKKNQWLQFFKILTKREKISFFFFLGFFIASAAFLSINFYLKSTKIVPADGGKYIEGLLGSPRFINPIYAPDSDTDRDLTELIFSGLMKYDEQGSIIPDLAADYPKILEDGRVYEFSLREKMFWQDGYPITADDIIFTINTVQNTDVKSPLRPSWLGVEAEKVSDYTVRFKLKNESSIFLENSTLKILPKHIWDKIPVENFPLSQLNLNPVGSGPYKLKTLVKDNAENIISLDLVRNPRYFSKKPHLEEITFNFYDSQNELIRAWKMGEVEGFSSASPADVKSSNDLINIYSFSQTRYFSAFFNEKDSKILSGPEIRRALNYGTDKSEILDKIISGRGKVIDSPVLPNIYGLNSPEKIYNFDIGKAKEILEKAGYTDANGDGFLEKVLKKEPAFQFQTNLYMGSKGKDVEELQKCLTRQDIYSDEVTGVFGEKTKEAVIKFQEKYSQDVLAPSGLEKGTGDVKKATRDKLNEVCFDKSNETTPLKFTLTTVDQPSLIKTAEILKDQWKKIGFDVTVKTLDSNTLRRDVLPKRDFDAVLFGEVLGSLPDPFPYWHSSQKGEYGYNLSNYENKEADAALEKARQTLDKSERKENLEKFQNILISDAPAVFLYNPDFLYFVSREIKGIKTDIIVDPSKRFNDIQDWYIKTKRTWQ